MLVSGPVTAVLTLTVVNSNKVMINDVKPDHSYTSQITRYGITLVVN